MIVLVTGSRHHDVDRVRDHIVEWVRSNLKDPGERVVIIHGDASGADAGAHFASLEPEWGELRLPAQWNVHGKSAGPRRNREMPALVRPDVCLAYPLPDSRGTLDMIQHARELGIETHVFSEEDL